MGETFSIVPTSALSGEGIPDMLLLLVQWTQKTMTEKLTYSEEVQCTVLEVKVIEGHGTTIDVVLVNGVLHEGDQIVVSGMQASIQNLTKFINTCFLHLTNKVYNIGSNCCHNSSFIDTSSNEGTSC
jgi:translation initiation factor IF-2